MYNYKITPQIHLYQSSHPQVYVILGKIMSNDILMRDDNENQKHFKDDKMREINRV